MICLVVCRLVPDLPCCAAVFTWSMALRQHQAGILIASKDKEPCHNMPHAVWSVRAPLVAHTSMYQLLSFRNKFEPRLQSVGRGAILPTDWRLTCLLSGCRQEQTLAVGGHQQKTPPQGGCQAISTCAGPLVPPHGRSPPADRERGASPGSRTPDLTNAKHVA